MSSLFQFRIDCGGKGSESLVAISGEYLAGARGVLRSQDGQSLAVSLPGQSNISPGERSDRLFAGGQAKRCDHTLAVLADREKRIERIVARDGISREYAAMRIDAQHPDSYFQERCGYILRNDGSAEEFHEACMKLFKEILNNG